MAVKSRIAAVTGANKGIGLAIVRNLALQYPMSPFNNGPFTIYLTARSAERGAEAVKTLSSDPQLKKAGALAEDGGETTIKYHPLDVSQTKSIQEFRDFLKKEHPEGIDIVINNAGIVFDGYSAEIVKKTLETNYYGTLEANQDLLPLIREGGRLVNVSSMAGRLTKYSPEVKKEFESAPDVPAVTALMQRFQHVADAGREKEEGFPTAAYAVSKAGVTAFTKVIAREESKRGKEILINACCPGYVNTDMTKGNGTKTPDQGAKTPVMLALGDIGDVTGEYWQNEAVREW